MNTIIKHIPKFPAGTILRTTQLKELVSQIYGYPDLMFNDFGDGIISGFDISEEKGNIRVGKGVICYDSRVFVLDKASCIPYKNNDKTTYLKICLESKLHTKDKDEYKFYIVLDENEPTDNDIELCRFRLQAGAKLRTSYDGFDDMNTEFDTANVIYSPYSSKGGHTLSPLVLNRFANEMLNLLPENPLDQNFCINILSSNVPLKIESIVAYLRCKGFMQEEKVTNIRVYRELVSILKQENKNTKITSKKAFTKRKIIID